MDAEVGATGDGALKGPLICLGLLGPIVASSYELSLSLPSFFEVDLEKVAAFEDAAVEVEKIEVDRADIVVSKFGGT